MRQLQYLSFLITVCSFAHFALICRSALINDAGHTGALLLRDIAAPQFMAFTAGVFILILEKRCGRISLSSLMATYSGASGVLLAVFLRYTNILLEYNQWLADDMPMPPLARDVYLIGVIVLYLAGFLLVHSRFNNYKYNRITDSLLSFPL